MKKLAVFFPGIGYTADKPLMHFSRRLAAEAGFEVLVLPYPGFPKKVKGDRSKMEESFRLALSQSKEMLSSTDFSEYNTILFVGKSIGTVVAAEIASQSSVSDRIHFVLYTPLENTFSFPLRNAIAFSGNADPWVQEGAIPSLCKANGIPCHVIPNANHSLETGCVADDIDVLKEVMEKTSEFIRHIEVSHSR